MHVIVANKRDYYELSDGLPHFQPKIPGLPGVLKSLTSVGLSTQSVIGRLVQLSEDDFVRMSEAFFEEIQNKFG